ncbi:MAG: DUF1028 domain-containing protein [Burkholderiales bacterium]
MTFQIAARCVKTGRFGVAITTRPMGVGSRCPFIESGVGLTVTMARTDPRLGPLGINLLKLGYSAQRVIDEIAASDPHIEMRQICVIDRDGNAVARTGKRNTDWSGALVRPNLVAMGNNLFSERTVSAMGEAWDASERLELEDRLLVALAAGRDAGGQNGGQHSSALLSYEHQVFPYCDLRVDEHAEPVGELRRLYDQIQPLLPFYYGRPAAPDAYGREDDWLARQGHRK